MIVSGIYKVMRLLLFVLLLILMHAVTAFAADIPEKARSYNGHLYYYYNNGLTWQQARSFCEEKGGHLATITSSEENSFIQSHFGSDYSWIGGYRKSGGSWEWVTGEKWTYTNWAYGEPNNDFNDLNEWTQPYLAINWNGSGMWDDGYADAAYGFICEWDDLGQNEYTKYKNAQTIQVDANIYGKDSGKGDITIISEENEFSKDSVNYNHSIAKLAISLATMAYNQKEETNRYKENAYRDLGYQNTTYVPDYTGNTSPYDISHKKILLNGEKTELIVVNVRGTYNEEWIDNFDPGKDEKTHKGFLRAAKFVYDGLLDYIDTVELNQTGSRYIIDKDAKLKILITGHSRGAATANLTGKMIDDAIRNQTISNIRKEDVFVYTFATPNVTSLEFDNKDYNNIYNIVNPEDFVTKVLLSKWGFKRYGTTYVLPSKDIDPDYSAYLDQLVSTCKKYDKKVEYAPYKDGMNSVADYVNYVCNHVKDTKEFYEKDLLSGSNIPFSDRSLQQLYQNALGKLLSNNDKYVSEAKGTIASALKIDYGHLGLNTVGFFIKYEKINPDFSNAHKATTYLAAMNVIEENRLKQGKKKYKGIVNCPVDITIQDDSGKVVGEITNNQIVQNTDHIVMDVEKESKTFSIPAGAKYSIKLSGNDTGTMDYSLCEIDPDIGETGRIFYESVPVSKGYGMEQRIEVNQELNDYELSDDSGKIIKKEIFDADSLGKLSVNINVTGKGSANSLSNLTPGDYVTLTAVPEKGNSFDGWYDNTGALLSTATDYSMSVTKNEELTAVFKEDPDSNSSAEKNESQMVSVKSITLSGLSKKIAAGKKVQLAAKVLPYDASNKQISWSTSNSKIATVTQTGLVTIKKKTGGKSVTITASAKDGSGVKASWKIKSMKGVVKSVKIKGSKSVKAGKKLKLKAKVKASKGANKTVKWTSDNTKWATVTSKGAVKTYKAGKGKKVKITAMATDGSGKKKTVTIKIK